jgi:hypothetical protein
MANQMVALQARAPQGGGLGPAIAQGAQMINMMAQQRAAERQAAQAQQAMDINAAQEARAAAKAVPEMKEAEAKAGAAQVKYVMDFMDASELAIANVRDPQQARAVGNRLKQMFPEPEFQQSIDETLGSLPQDPAQFEAWREQALFLTMDAKDQLAREFQRQTTGREERIVSMPKYGQGGAVEVPGSRIEAAEGMQYIKDDEGNIRAVPKEVGGSFGTPPPGGGDTFSRMIGVESRGKQFDRSGRPLTSPAGAIGIAQVMPATAPEAARLAGLPFDDNRYRNDADYNLALGKAYYEKQLADFGDERLAAAAYNAGPGAVRRALQKGGPDGWINHVPRETQNYVRSVFGESRGAAGGGAPIVVKGTGDKGAPKTTEAERRFGTISRQMRTNLKEAINILDKNPEAIRPSGLEYAASQIPVYGEEARLFAESEPRQQFVASILRFLDNVTFVNTGAGTSKTQEDNYRRSYIPTYQDTNASAYRKLVSMVEFAKNVKDAAGVLWTPELDADFNMLSKAVEKLKPKAKAKPAAAPRTTPTRSSIPKDVADKYGL